MIKTNRYLSSALFDQHQNEQQSLKVQNVLNKLLRHPVTGFAIFSLVLTLLQSLSTDGYISSSFVTAVGSTVIFVIVGLGFCLLLGYSALASALTQLTTACPSGA